MLSDGGGGQYGEGVLDVEAHLRDEGLDAVEPQRGPQARDELDEHLLAVQVEVVTSDDVRLDDPHEDVAEGGVGPDGDGCRKPLPLAAVAAQPTGVHAVGG